MKIEKACNAKKALKRMLAFKEAYDVLNSAPPSPPIGEGSRPRSFGDTIKQIERNFARDVAKWRSELLALRPHVKKSLEDLIRESDDVRGPLQQLQELIDFSEKMLDVREVHHKALTRALTSEAHQLATVSREDARAFRKSTRRYLDLVADEYDDRASFFRFLKQLHADHDPDAHGGPTFDNAEDLIANLRN